jgi:hypothetical protein
MAVIQRRLGHESILTTIDIYGHLTDRAEDSACEALDGIFGVPRLASPSPAPGVVLVGGGLIVTETEDAVTTAAQDPSVVPDAPGDRALTEWDLDDSDDLAA